MSENNTDGFSLAPLAGTEPAERDDEGFNNLVHEQIESQKLHDFLDRALGGGTSSPFAMIDAHVYVLENGQLAVQVGEPGNAVAITAPSLEELYRRLDQYLSTLP